VADEEVVPKKEKDEGPGRVRSIYAPDPLWEEITHAAKREGYSVSKMVAFLLKAGLRAYLKQRALQAEKSASDEKP
jgi:hypothetical protein